MSNGTLPGDFATGVALINGTDEFAKGVPLVAVEKVTAAKAGCATTSDAATAAVTLGRFVGFDDNTVSAGSSGGTD